MTILLLSLTFVVKDMFNLRYLRTFSQVLATFIKIFLCSFCIFKCILILLIGNIKCYHKTVFTVLFIQTKINKQTKLSKTVVKMHESL